MHPDDDPVAGFVLAGEIDQMFVGRAVRLLHLLPEPVFVETGIAGRFSIVGMGER
jgi:hypothetical protein